METERFKMIAFTALILRDGEKILLIRRHKTGSFDGLYACAGGGVDENEPATAAMIREAHEELGITLKKDNLKIAHIVHRGPHDGGSEFVGFFIEASEWEGEPQNMEPDKCDEIAWFHVDKLPENIIPTLKHVMEMLKQNIFYSEYGWE